MTVEYAEIDYDECLAETPTAVLLVIQGADQVWVPRSLIDDDEGVPEPTAGAGTVHIALWWAERQGLV